jgi:predicted oxidoreductase (fatty acid repression mutant protein)
MSAAFLAAIQARRTHYGLSKASTIPDANLKSIIRTAITHVPSPFNVQSGRVVLLLGKESDALWEIVRSGFLKTLAGDKAAIKLYDGKITEYKQGYGTILFFEDTVPIDAIAAQRPGQVSSTYSY